MDFKTAFNLTEEMTHEEKYEAIVNGLGYNLVKACVPFERNEIVEALKTDRHMNNLAITKWDDATGFKTVTTSSSQNYYPTNKGLISVCRKKGINVFSISELVCTLKRCAVMWAEEEITKEQKGR